MAFVHGWHILWQFCIIDDDCSSCCCFFVHIHCFILLYFTTIKIQCVFSACKSGSFKTFLLANISPSVSFQIFLTCLGSLINYFTSIVQYIYNYYYLVAGCVLLDSFSVCFKMSCCFLHWVPLLWVIFTNIYCLREGGSESFGWSMFCCTY